MIELDDGGSHTFKERSEDMGSWQVRNPTLLTGENWRGILFLPFLILRNPAGEIYFQAVRKVSTIEAKGEGEEVGLYISILILQELIFCWPGLVEQGL